MAHIPVDNKYYPATHPIADPDEAVVQLSVVVDGAVEIPLHALHIPFYKKYPVLQLIAVGTAQVVTPVAHGTQLDK